MNIKNIKLPKLNWNFDKTKKYLLEHKTPVIAILVVVLFACISIIISYAFYQVTDSEAIIGGQVGEIADLEVRVMAQNRDANGNAIEGYSIYPYIPKAGYVYNESKSYCTNGSTIEYSNYEATIRAKSTDVCYLYFDSVASLDITLNVYAQDVDSNGEGIPNQYTKLETTALPSIGYVFNREKSSCNNGSTVTYSDEDNLFSVEASGKDVCNAYMDALDVDISLKLYIQAKAGSSTYYEATSIPTNNFYEINNSKSSCTGSSTLSMTRQKVIISATGKTSCEAYLDVGSGPIVEEVKGTLNGTTVNLNFKGSNAGTNITRWYYSTNGTSYSSTTNSTASVTVTNDANYTIYVYGVDANSKESGVVTASGYAYNGIFSYSSSVRSKQIIEEGYYKLETWGAQGGTYSSSYGVGGKGGYSTGIVHLNAGDTLYVHTGGQGSYYSTSTYSSTGGGGVNGGGAAAYRGGTGGGATDIRINTDSLYARVIVAGGGGGAYSYNSTYKANGGAGGGTTGGNGAYYSSSYTTYVGKGGTQTGGGAAVTGSSSTYNGKAGKFGSGGGTGYKYNSTSYYSNGAGGGGWYGGSAAANYNGGSYNYASGGGGGSGYVYTASTAANYPSGCLLNEEYYLSSASTTAGTVSFTSPTGTAETGHSGAGYAKVVYIGKTLS